MGKKNHQSMGRSTSPVVVHRLSLAEQRVLSSFLAGRLAAGQVHAELERARVAPPAPVSEPAPAVQPVPAVAA
jgi:hypothetical protein